MLIAQITDLHLGFSKGGGFEDNARRLRRTIEAVKALNPLPEIVLATGDLSDHGDLPSYRRLKRYFSRLPMPVFCLMGNHDKRDAFLQIFPGTPVADGFIHYAIEEFPLRILALDTLENGRHGGGFCDVRAAWLAARLAEAPDRPTLIALHHPPFDTGIEWMNIGPDEAWSKRLAEVLSNHANIVGLICGHVHRQIVSTFAGTTVRVCPSTQPQVSLDLGTMDLDHPDGRPMIVAGPPAFGVHRWNGKTLVSHYTDADEQLKHKVLARYTAKMQRFMRHLAEERGVLPRSH